MFNLTVYEQEMHYNFIDKKEDSNVQGTTSDKKYWC